MKTAYALFTALLMLLAASAAHAQARPVLIEDAWVRVLQGTATAYFHILNNSEAPDRLLGVSTSVAGKAELVRTRALGGKYTYQPIDSLEIGGFEDPRLIPGGIHVRLTGLRRDLAVGETVPLNLRFERSGNIEVAARVTNQALGNR